MVAAVILAAILIGTVLIFVNQPTPPPPGPDGSDKIPFLRIGGMAVDPGDSRKIFVGTQSGLVRGFSYDPPDWKYTGRDRSHISAYVMHPAAPHRMYISGRGGDGAVLGLTATNDAGVTWETISLKAEAQFDALTISPRDPRILYGWDSIVRVLRRSADGGVTWTSVSTPDARGAISLAAHPADANTVFAGTESGLYRSVDAGQSWSPFGDLPAGTPVTALAASPIDARYMYGGLAGGAVVFTLDGGLTWKATVGLLPPGRQIAAIAAAHDHSAHLIVAANPVGIFETQDGGQTWTERVLPPQ